MEKNKTKVIYIWKRKSSTLQAISDHQEEKINIRVPDLRDTHKTENNL